MTARACGSPRDGGTLIELLVAIVLLSVGVLSLAETSRVTIRQTGQERVLSTAAAVAQARLERLRAIPCKTIAGGSAQTNAVQERWVRWDTTQAVIVADTVSWPGIAGRVRSVYVSAVPCQNFP